MLEITTRDGKQFVTIDGKEHEVSGKGQISVGDPPLEGRYRHQTKPIFTTGQRTALASNASYLCRSSEGDGLSNIMRKSKKKKAVLRSLYPKRLYIFEGLFVGDKRGTMKDGTESIGRMTAIVNLATALVVFATVSIPAITSLIAGWHPDFLIYFFVSEFLRKLRV